MTQANSVTGNLQPVTGNLQPVTGHSGNTVRTIRWPYNYNNKMCCSGGFIHIDLPPEQKPVRSEVENMIVKVATADNSHPPVLVTLFDMLFLPLKKIPCAFTLASHGMMEGEFAKFIIEKYPERVTLDTELAVFYYKKMPI